MQHFPCAKYSFQSNALQYFPHTEYIFLYRMTKTKCSNKNKNKFTEFRILSEQDNADKLQVFRSMNDDILIVVIIIKTKGKYDETTIMKWVLFYI